jgi:hypothetical protein
MRWERTAVLDDGEERFVVWKIKSRTTLFKLWIGEVVRKGSLKNIGSADFTGDGRMSFWPQTEKQILLFQWKRTRNLPIKSVGRLLEWTCAYIIRSAFVVVSAEENLHVYDSKLKIVNIKQLGQGRQNACCGRHVHWDRQMLLCRTI